MHSLNVQCVIPSEDEIKLLCLTEAFSSKIIFTGEAKPTSIYKKTFNYVLEIN